MNTRERIKTVARGLLPPVLVDALRRARPTEGSLFSGRYPDFAAALAAASPSGYQTDAVIEGTIRRTRQIREAAKQAPERAPNQRAIQDLAALFVLDPGRGDGPLRVLDFGGGMGVHYFTLRPLLPWKSGVRWTVCETAATARAGRNNFANEELSFVDDLDGLTEPFEVAMASGALQYTDAPVRHFRRLSMLSDRLIVNRAPFCDASEDRVVLQHVRGTFYQASLPTWFFSEAGWLGHIATAGFEVALRWLVPEDTVSLDDRAVVYQGFALRRRG